MVIAILADEQSKQELLARGVEPEVEFVWADSVRSLGIIEADVYMDLEFEFNAGRIQKLKRLLPKPVLVNSIVHTLDDIAAPFIRINAWPTMLNRPIIELAIAGPAGQAAVNDISQATGWNCELVPDIIGMVTPRIVAMMINEARYLIGESRTGHQEIDRVIRSGTHCPYGPLEWGEKIGLPRVANLLQELAKSDSRYTVASSLLNVN